jgi:hypothetical protein
VTARRRRRVSPDEREGRAAALVALTITALAILLAVVLGAR